MLLRLFSLAALALVTAPRVAATYFNVQVPSSTSPWVSNSTNPVSWSLGATALVQFDIELLRLSGTGLLLVAKNVPVSAGTAVIDVEGIAEGDDYFLVFLDSYDGTVYTRSSRFSIRSGNKQSTTVEASITLTITGSPNPTRAFETTLPALATTTGLDTYYTSAAFPAALMRPLTVSAVVGAVLLGAAGAYGVFLE